MSAQTAVAEDNIAAVRSAAQPATSTAPAAQRAMDRTRNRQLAIEGTQRWMLAGMAGMAAAMLVSFAGMLDLLPPAAESLAVFVCGWAVFALLAPRAIMLELERDDRPTIARLAERARAVADGDRRVPLQSLALDRDDELGMLSRVVHDLAAAAHAHRQQARLMKRRMGHHVRLETHKATFHLQREAMTDPLTGLGNRRALRRHVDRLIARHGAGAMVTVMLVDVDRFKHVNDAFGHGAGDRCLMFLSEVLRSCLRKHDVLIRMGGDEFAVIMPLVDVASVRPAAQRLAGVFGQMPWPHGTASRPTLSIGIAQGLAGELLDAATLLTRADAALYDAKRAGRSAIVNSP